MTYVASQLTVVQVTLENDKFAVLQVVDQRGCSLGHAPVAAAVGPELVGAEGDFALGVQGAPVSKDAVDRLLLLSRELGRRSALGLLVVIGGLVEGLGVLEHVEGVGEVSGHNVRDEPRDVLGAEDDVSSEAGLEQVSGEHKVNEELEASVVEDDIDAAVFLATELGFLEHAESSREVVGDDLVLVGFAGLGALELLHFFETEVHQQGEIGGVAPKADLAHLDEECLLGLGAVFLGEVRQCRVVGLQGLEYVVVVVGQLDHTGAR